MPAALALVAAAAIMLALAFAIERLVLRPLVNQDGLILFMATIGITFFITGFGQALFGSDVYTLDLGIPKNPLILFEALVPGGILVNEFDLWAAVMAGVLVAVLAVFFQRTRIGRALRAVADDHQAALVGRHPAAAHLGHRLVRWRGWSHSPPGSSGAQSSGCSSRSRLSR